MSEKEQTEDRLELYKKNFEEMVRGPLPHTMEAYATALMSHYSEVLSKESKELNIGTKELIKGSKELNNGTKELIKEGKALNEETRELKKYSKILSILTAVLAVPLAANVVIFLWRLGNP